MTVDEHAESVETPSRFPCRKCGAELAYRPGTTSLVCGYCGHEHAIDVAETAPVIEELDYREHLAALAEAEPTTATGRFKCSACRAEVTPASNVTAMSCPYCDANLVAQDKGEARIRPRWLLPFALGSEDAWARYRAWITSRWFAPTKLKRYAHGEGFRGMYVPYWTYDSDTVTDYTGLRGDNYTVTVGSGKNRRTETRTRWSPASGRVRNRFDDLLVPATRSLPAPQLDRIDPWDLESLVAYDEDYVSGFSAESHQVDLEEGFGVAKKAMDREIHATICGDIGGDRQQVHQSDVHHQTITFKHILVPVWVNVYRYRGRVFRTLVNGRTGEVQGERPYSWVKITLAILAGVLVIGGVALIIALSN